MAFSLFNANLDLCQKALPGRHLTLLHEYEVRYGILIYETFYIR